TFYNKFDWHPEFFTARDRQFYPILFDRFFSYKCKLKVRKGDFIGIYWSNGSIKLDEDVVEHNGFWQCAGDQTSTPGENFVFEPSKTISFGVGCIRFQFIKTEIKADAIASPEDIKKVGGKKTLTINNQLIQTNEKAQEIADAYLAEYKDQKKKITITRPIPLPYEIGDTIKWKIRG
ncbi:unnamed protein product, partial [marine sediment metagenome]